MSLSWLRILHFMFIMKTNVRLNICLHLKYRAFPSEKYIERKFKDKTFCYPQKKVQFELPTKLQRQEPQIPAESSQQEVCPAFASELDGHPRYFFSNLSMDMQYIAECRVAWRKWKNSPPYSNERLILDCFIFIRLIYADFGRAQKP